jgi:hypothetical protein
MNRSVALIMVVLAAVLCLCLPGRQCLGGEKVHKMTGEIAAIDLAYNTVVVEVPMGERVFTVGGPLSPEAILHRGGQSADLADFHRGDRVSVTWEATERGHLILSLEAT